MSQSDGFSLDIQTIDFRYIYNSDFDGEKSSSEEEKTAELIYNQLYQCYCDLMMGP